RKAAIAAPNVERISQTRDLFTTLRRELLNFLLPLRCPGCDAFMPPQAAQRLCSVCVANLQRLNPPLCNACGVPLAPAAGLALCVRCAKNPPVFGKARA